MLGVLAEGDQAGQRCDQRARAADIHAKEERVLMERDGITPECTQHDANKQMREYAIIIKRHLRDLYGSY